MTVAYDVERKQVAKMIAQYPTCEQLTSTLPVKIWTTANEVTHYPLIHSKQYEQHRLSLQSPISLSLYLMEKNICLNVRFYNFIN